MGCGLLLEVDIWLFTVWRVVSGQPASVLGSLAFGCGLETTTTL